MPQRHHAGAEDVAIRVHHALAVAEQIPFALQALVEEFGVLCRPLGDEGIDQGELLAELDARLLEGRLDALSAADEDGRAEAVVQEHVGGAHHLLLLALGEDDALGVAAHLLEDALQPAGHRIEPGAETRRVGLHVHDGAPRHP